MEDLTEEDLLLEFYRDKPKLKLPNDRQIKSIYQLYRPSYLSLSLASEVGRNIFAESLSHELDPRFPQSLRELAITVFAQSYKGGRIDSRIILDDLELFGQLIDIELPLKVTFMLECDTYWERVVQFKSKKSLTYETLKATPDVNWKKKGIEAKLVDLIETTAPNDWDLDALSELSEQISQFVEELDIKSLKSLNKFDHKYVDEHIENIPFEICHHGSLAFIQYLKNLHTISIRFVTPALAREYRKEKFEHSYEDIENLSRGIRNLCSLKVLRINDSPMDHLKIDRLLTDLNDCVQLEEIDFRNCQLMGDCIIAISLYMGRVSCVRRIELAENKLDEKGMRSLGFGLQKTKSRLDYLGLAGNPLTHGGAEELGKGIAMGRNVVKLNLARCDVESEGTYRITQMIQLKAGLTQLDISNIKFSKNAGDLFLTAVQDNFEVLELECRGCFTTTQELWLRLFVERNNFYSNNPCLKKEIFNKDDEVEIEMWLKRVKHPLLLETKSFMNQLLSKKSGKKSIENISEDLTDSRVIKTNDEIFGVELLSSYKNDYFPFSKSDAKIKKGSKIPKGI